MASSGGGVFLPGDPPPSTNQTLTTPTISGGTISSATISSPTMSAPVISGAATLASGATLTTPHVLFTVDSLTATGATGSAAAAASAIRPSIVLATGASGAGIDLGTGAAGDFSIIQNLMTGVLKVYSVGGTINGTTGTTAVSITATGNLTALAVCSAAGTWFVRINT